MARSTAAAYCSGRRHGSGESSQSADWHSPGGDRKVHPGFGDACGEPLGPDALLPSHSPPARDGTRGPGQYPRLSKARMSTLSELFMMFARPGSRRLARLFRPVFRRHAVVEASNEAPPGLEPGDWVEVRSGDEILQSLGSRRMHRGLSFGGDMYEKCGRRMRACGKGDRLIEEGASRLRPVQDAVILDTSVCDRYFGCARGMPFLWREAWLKRAAPGPSSNDLPGRSLQGPRT